LLPGKVAGLEPAIEGTTSQWRHGHEGSIARLDQRRAPRGQNGLLLTPSIDHFFDRGFISFRNDGRLLVSKVAHAPSLERIA